MSTPERLLADPPDVEHLTTEDDTPVDNFPSEKQQRLLTESLYSSWRGPGEGRSFIAAANVGLFASVHRPPIVPDVLLALDVTLSPDWWAKEHRSYFVWEFGKVPEVVVEIVSNREGKENESKLRDYQAMRVSYYAIYDPLLLIQPARLRVYELRAAKYEERDDGKLPEIGLGLALWEGTFEGMNATWLRWCDATGALIPTGAERAEHERERAEHERERAEHERERAEHERGRAERLAERLRALGVDPDEL